MTGGYAVCAAVSILLFAGSYLIWKKKHLHLIAGYSEDSFAGDKEKLARVMGLFCAMIGILTLLLPLGINLFGGAAGIVFGVVVSVSSISLAIYAQNI